MTIATDILYQNEKYEPFDFYPLYIKGFKWVLDHDDNIAYARCREVVSDAGVGYLHVTTFSIRVPMQAAGFLVSPRGGVWRSEPWLEGTESVPAIAPLQRQLNDNY